MQLNKSDFGGKAENLLTIKPALEHIKFTEIPGTLPLCKSSIKKLFKPEDINEIQQIWNEFIAHARNSDSNLDNQQIARLHKICDILERSRGYLVEILQNSKEPSVAELVKFCINNRSCIARSSGFEDSKEHANAGGNESIGFGGGSPENIVNAMLIVLKSYFSEHSLQQQLSSNKNLSSNFPFAILMQKMVPTLVTNESSSTRSGVVTATSDDDYFYLKINSNWGHNACVVDGQNPLDTYHLKYNKHTKKILVSKTISIKTNYATTEKDEIIFKKLPENLSRKPSLNDADLEKLSELVKVIFNNTIDLDNSGIDIEFSITPDKLFLLQYRALVRYNQDKSNNHYIPYNIAMDFQKLAEIHTLDGSNAGPENRNQLFLCRPEEVLTCHNLNSINLNEISKYKLVISEKYSAANSHIALEFNKPQLPPCLQLSKDQINDFKKILAENSETMVVLNAQLNQIILAKNEDIASKLMKTSVSGTVDLNDGEYSPDMSEMSLKDVRKTQEYYESIFLKYKKKAVSLPLRSLVMSLINADFSAQELIFDKLMTNVIKVFYKFQKESPGVLSDLFHLMYELKQIREQYNSDPKSNFKKLYALMLSQKNNIVGFTSLVTLLKQHKQISNSLSNTFFNKQNIIKQQLAALGNIILPRENLKKDWIKVIYDSKDIVALSNTVAQLINNKFPLGEAISIILVKNDSGNIITAEKLDDLLSEHLTQKKINSTLFRLQNIDSILENAKAFVSSLGSELNINGFQKKIEDLKKLLAPIIQDIKNLNKNVSNEKDDLIILYYYKIMQQTLNLLDNNLKICYQNFFSKSDNQISLAEKKCFIENLIYLDKVMCDILDLKEDNRLKAIKQIKNYANGAQTISSTTKQILNLIKNNKIKFEDLKPNTQLKVLKFSNEKPFLTANRITWEEMQNELNKDNIDSNQFKFSSNYSTLDIMNIKNNDENTVMPPLTIYDMWTGLHQFLEQVILSKKNAIFDLKNIQPEKFTKIMDMQRFDILNLEIDIGGTIHGTYLIPLGEHSAVCNLYYDNNNNTFRCSIVLSGANDLIMDKNGELIGRWQYLNYTIPYLIQDLLGPKASNIEASKTEGKSEIKFIVKNISQEDEKNINFIIKSLNLNLKGYCKGKLRDTSHPNTNSDDVKKFADLMQGFYLKNQTFNNN